MPDVTRVRSAAPKLAWKCAESARAAPGLEARRVAGHEARAAAHLARPARPAAGQRARIEAAAVDDHVRVPGVGVDRDARAGPRLAPAHEAGRVERALEQPRGGECVGDRAGAVIA